MLDGWDNKDLDNVITYDVTGLTPGITYYVRVRAYNDTDYSEWSNVLTITTDYWFLPSRDLMMWVYFNLYNAGIGAFTADTYWSSFEDVATLGYGVEMGSGTPVSRAKDTTQRVRPCHSFTDSAGHYSEGDIGPYGGYICYKDGTTAYEVSNEAYETTSTWSNITDIAIGTTSTAVNESKNNTNEIIAQVGHINSAAKYCKDLNV